MRSFKSYSQSKNPDLFFNKYPSREPFIGKFATVLENLNIQKKFVIDVDGLDSPEIALQISDTTPLKAGDKVRLLGLQRSTWIIST